MKKANKIKAPVSERFLYAANILLLIVISFTMLYPFWDILVKSFMTDLEINRHRFSFWPTQFHFEAYEIIFTDVSYRFGRAFFNSVIITVLTTVYQLAITAMTAYALTRKTLPGKNFFFVFFIITMYFGGGMVPYYTVVKFLGLSDTLSVMIIPSFLSVFNMLVVRAFFQGLPAELEEAAKIDGASDFKVFFSIVLPLSGAVLATIALFIAVGKWNDWMTGLLYVDEKSLYIMQNYLRTVLISSYSAETNNPDILNKGESIVMASIVVGTLPVIASFPFVQKYFIKGMILGSVKE